MKALDCNINKKKEEEETTENHTKKKKKKKKKREIISETHLTARGVCTTIRPENSGM
jgi:hypothetical protein